MKNKKTKSEIDLPSSKEAEQSVIGGLLIDSKPFLQVKLLITSSDFYYEVHRTIFEAITQLIADGLPIDIIVLSEYLNKQGTLDSVGGGQYLGMLFTNTPTAANIIAYTKIVKEKSLERKLIQATTKKQYSVIQSISRQLETQDYSGEPLPLQEKQINTNKFPVQALGSILQSAVESVTSIIQCPTELTAQTFLAAVTLATQALAKVKAKESWPPMLINNYFLLIGKPGEGKGGTETFAFAPIRHFSRQAEDKYDTEYKQFLQSKKRGKNDEEFEEKDEPLAKGLFYEIATIPGIYKGFLDGRSNCMLLNDDIAAFFKGWSMQDGRQAEALANLCKLCDTGAGSYQKASGPGRYFYDRVFSISGGIQPVFWEEIKSEGIMGSQGILSRMLLIFPETSIGNRPWVDKNIDAELSPYKQRITELLERSFSPQNINEKGEISFHRTLTLSKGAKDIYRDFYNDTQKELKEGGLYGEVEAYLNKFDKQPPKISSVLSLFYDPDTTIITEDWMMKAVLICQFYIQETLFLFGKINIDAELQLASKLKTWLYDKGLKYSEDNQTYTLAKIQKYCVPNAIRKKSKLLPILEILDAHNYGFLTKEGRTYYFSINKGEQFKLM